MGDIRKIDNLLHPLLDLLRVRWTGRLPDTNKRKMSYQFYI